MSRIVSFLNTFVDFFYPRLCLVCGNKITLDYSPKTKINNNPRVVSTEFCCNVCKANVVYAPSKEETLSDIIQFHSSSSEFAISNAIALFENTEEPQIINLIYKLKYFGFTRVGIEYGKWLGEKITLENSINDYDFIAPVPIHSTKKRHRGYNQSDYIATGINRVLNKTVITNLLIRKKYTTSQTELNVEERLNNVKDIFELNCKYNVKGKNILLVDDVLTTGSTLNNCALTLLYGRARRVDVATLLKPFNRHNNHF